MGFALDLFLKVAQIHAIFFFHRGVHGVRVGGTGLVLDREAGRAHHRALPGLAAYEFPCFFGVLHFHERLNTGVGHHLLCALFIGLENARVILTGHNGRNAQPPALGQHHLKARRHNGRVFIHNAEVRPNADGIRGQSFQGVGGIAFNLSAKAHSAGIANGRQTDLAETRQLRRGFFQRRQEHHEDAPLPDGISEIHFSIFRSVDMAVGVRQAGQSLAEIRLGVTELFREGRRLILQLPPCDPAGGAQRRLDGCAGFRVQLRVQG